MPSAFNFSVLGTDMHSHLVPGIDDGADHMETSLALIKGLSELGYKKIITTPHVRPDYFPNTEEGITSGFEKVKKAVHEAGIAVELDFAAEYYVDYDFAEKLERDQPLTFSGNHILMELSTFSPPPNLHDILFQARIKGYQPVLAHPERYVYFDLKEFEKLKDFGCLLQLNLLSIAGHYGKNVKELALKLLKAGFVDLWGTDCHHQRHLDELGRIAADAKLMALVTATEFRNPSL